MSNHKWKSWTKTKKVKNVRSSRLQSTTIEHTEFDAATSIGDNLVSLELIKKSDEATPSID